MNAKCKMQNAKLKKPKDLFCILHSAFCISILIMNDDTLKQIDTLRERIQSVRSYL